ncbi:YihY/virulence factor BrkB family protein [Miltoncostaea marina]|uniref:YihY/virulence factor BrkB family protein n=1 Tax=Miltoncostaea marina TaxID=2843215 RepID=UPI001C3DC227|nr:YihY/virulence factor BrkB family protein [Miltoncostaea marina]
MTDDQRASGDPPTDEAVEDHPPRTDWRPTGVDQQTSLWATLRRTFAEFKEDDLTDWSAALTYYGLLSLFPALLAVSSLIGLFADPQTITDVILEIAPESAADTLQGPIDSITSNEGAAGFALVVGLAGALWGASGYVAAFGRASNVIYETREGRPFWKLRPIQLLITLVLVVLMVVVVGAVVLTGPIVEAIAGPLGIGDTAVTVWDYAKWPVLALMVVVMLSILYWSTPNVRQRGWRAVVPGVVVSLVIWAVASAAFAFYVANFGAYDRTYGSLGGVIVLLVWMWISNLALLLGAELNAERERSRQFAEEVPGADVEIQLEPRDEPKRPQTS